MTIDRYMMTDITNDFLLLAPREEPQRRQVHSRGKCRQHLVRSLLPRTHRPHVQAYIQGCALGNCSIATCLYLLLYNGDEGWTDVWLFIEGRPANYSTVSVELWTTYHSSPIINPSSKLRITVPAPRKATNSFSGGSPHGNFSALIYTLHEESADLRIS